MHIVFIAWLHLRAFSVGFCIKPLTAVPALDGFALDFLSTEWAFLHVLSS
jgi:hypothetical protein